MIYIVDSFCISPQPSHEGMLREDSVVVMTGNKCKAIEPNYQGLIPNSLLRRMGKAVRMAVGSGLHLLKDQEIHGIIVGTGNGGLEDCVKFLMQIIDWEEGRLTPTNFVQSTANASAGTLALLSKNKHYNATHVHKGLSFDNALLDAQMRIEEGKGSRILVGGVEELSTYNFNIEWQRDRFKKEEETVDSNTLFDSKTKGAIAGEGSCFFILSDQPTANAVQLEWTAQLNGTVPDISHWVKEVLATRNLALEDIDAIIDGRNGDIDLNNLYQQFTSLFPAANQYAYKHLTGEYPSSSAFATWLGAQLLTGEIPASYQLKGGRKSVKNVLIYNSYLGRQHGLIFLSKP